MLYQFRRPLSQDLAFMLMAAGGWVLWSLILRADRPAVPTLEIVLPFAGWAGMSAVAGVMVLYWIDFFKPFKLFKFLPDVVTLWFSFGLAAIVFKPIAGTIFVSELVRYREIMLGAAVPAILVGVWESLSIWARSKSTVKSTIYLALTEGERERFLEVMQAGRWRNHFRVLTQSEFDGALATGGRVDYIVISRVATKNFIAHQNLLQAHSLGVRILDYRMLLSQIRGCISLHDTDIWTFLAGSERQSVIHWLYRVLKFYFEPVVAALMLLAFAPLFIVVAIAIKLTSRGPVFFRQLRTGYLGVEFELVKFRSMRVDAEASGAQWATKQDNRVTPMGRLLRKTRLDELPQLWNVLRGEMSFMGPRPERPEFYEIIGKQVPHFKLRLLTRPGITGWAQLLAGYAASVEESEKKLEFDLYYMQYMSPRMDLIIVWKTILLLLGGRSGQ